MARGDGQAGSQPFAFVVPVLAAMTRDQRVVIEYVDAVVACGNAAQFAVDLARESGLAGFGLAVKNAETRMSGSFERVDNERGLTVLAERADPLLVAARNASRGLVGDFGREIGELADEIRCHILGANCQNDRVGAKR